MRELLIRAGELGGQALEILRYPAVIGLLWFMHKLTRMLYRDTIERLERECAGLREDRNFERERKEKYKQEAHDALVREILIARQLHDCLGERRKPPDEGTDQKEA